jgi:hypothetical protein
VKAGDLVKFKKSKRHNFDSACGLLIEIRPAGPAGEYGVMWDFLEGQIGWQREWEIEVIDEER